MVAHQQRGDPMTPAEKEITERIVRDAIAAGYLLSVNDGEETTVTRSTDFAEITGALATTDDDFLIFHKDGANLGSIWFVYGNEDGVVVCDYHVKLEPFLSPINEWSESKWG
jgi:hypothetical protein